MKNSILLIGKLFLFLLLLLSPVLGFSQAEIELIIPEGIKKSLLTAVKNHDQSDLVLCERESNKIVVWDLTANKEKLNLKLSSEIIGVAYHPSDKYIYASTTQSVYIIDADNGNIIRQKAGSNAIKKNFSPFMDDRFLYIADNQLHIGNIFSDGEQKIDTSDEDFYPVSANYAPNSQEIFLFTEYTGVYVFDKSLISRERQIIETDSYGDYYVFDNKLFRYRSGGSPNFEVYDLKSGQLTTEITIQQDDYANFYNKSKKYIGHYQDKLFVYERDNIIVRDLTTGKAIKSIPLKFKEVHDIVLSEYANALMVHGTIPHIDEYGNNITVEDIDIYDLTGYTRKKFESPIENKSMWAANHVVFDDDNFFIYRFAEDQILKNDIRTGHLISSFQVKKGKEIDVYSHQKPKIVNNKYILVTLNNEEYKKSIACIDIDRNRIVWFFDKIENSFFQVKINQKQDILTIIDEGYPNNAYTVLDIETGKTLFQENSTEKLKIYPVNNDRILQLSTYEEVSWNNPVREFHISEHFVSQNKTTLYKIPTVNIGWNDDALLSTKNLYVKFTNHLLTFDLNDLSKPKDSISLDMQDYKLIDVHDNRYLYIHNISKEKILKVYDLTERKMILAQEDLSFASYLRGTKQILVKNSNDDLSLFDITTQKLTPTQVNLSQTRDIKILHDKWLIYSDDKNENIYDLVNNRIKHRLDKSGIMSVSRDGHLYYDYQKIKLAKDGSDFVVLPGKVALPSSMRKISLDEKSDEIVYLDDNNLLSFLDLSQKKLNTFQLFSSSGYDVKYERLNGNLFLLSNDASMLEKEYKILDINNGKTVNLSDNAFEIGGFELNNEQLIITDNERLKIFDLDNAEQLFEAESFGYRILDNTLIIFRDREKISLYDTESNVILWETQMPFYLGGGHFSTTLGNTIFTTISETEIGALDLGTGKIKSRHTLPSNLFTLGSFFAIEPISIHPQTNHIYVNVGNLEGAEYLVFDYKNDEFIALNIDVENAIDIPKLKTDYQINENDNFSLNNNILAVYKYDTRQFSVYDTQSKTTLFEQDIALGHSGLTWEVMESRKIIFLYNRSGNLLFIDYGNKKSSQHKIDGNKFKIYNNLLFVSDYGKKIDVYEYKGTKSLTKLYSLIPMPNGSYIFYTPEGYYLSTKEGAKHLQFKQNEKLYPFEQFDLVYNRPDVVLKAMKSTNAELIKMYENAHKKRLKRHDYTVTTSLNLAPDAHIIRKSALPEDHDKSVAIEINADAKADRLCKIVIKVNDNLYKEIPTDSKKHHATENVPLNKGQNTIEVYALNSKNIKGISDKLDIFHKEEEFKSPKVYFFGIGVSDYEDESFNLKYASKDIQDMAGTLSERYPDMDTNILLDSDVTVENIKKFKQKLSQTHTDDLVIISLCGHGVLDEGYNWYFATHDMDFQHPQKRGFSYADLINLTNNIASRQKLITLDACHSGEVDTDEIGHHVHDINHQNDHEQEEIGNVVATKRGSNPVNITKDGGKTSFALMKQMFADLESSNGTIVISASGGMEYAFEGGNYRNGVFTYSILNLLYDSVWNTLKVSELQKAVMENVYRLTNGRQQPNVRTGTLNYDWVVW